MKITNNSVITCTFRRLQFSVINLRVNCRLNCGADVVSVDSARITRERTINIMIDSFMQHHVMHVGLVWTAQNKCKSCSRQIKTSQEDPDNLDTTK